jgi:hypothetical protein
MRKRFVRSNRFGPAIYDRKKKLYAPFEFHADRDMRLLQLWAGEIRHSWFAWCAGDDRKGRAAR